MNRKAMAQATITNYSGVKIKVRVNDTIIHTEHGELTVIEMYTTGSRRCIRYKDSSGRVMFTNAYGKEPMILSFKGSL